MLKCIFAFILLCTLSINVYSQQLSSQEMVAITPMISDALELPDNAKKSLANKLTQMAVQNGFGSISGEFVLTANTVILNKQVTATAPPKYVVDLETSFFIVNVLEGTIVGETSVTTQGLDGQEHKAIIQAINQIKPKSPAIRKFMEESRAKIIEYYNTRIPALISKATSLADRHQYKEALTVLAAIPESVDQYSAVAEQMTSIYIKMLDRDATETIQKAKSKIALKDYEAALDELVKVDPSSSKSKEAYALIESIKKSIDEKEKAEMEERMQRYEDSKEAALRAYDDKVMLEKMRIESAQKVGVENAKNQSSVKTGLNDWFMGKFK